MAPLPSISWNFGDESRATVLIEFDNNAVPANYAPIGDRTRRLNEHCNVDVLEGPPAGPSAPGGAGAAAPAIAAMGGRRRFLEVKSKDERSAIDVASTVQTVFGEEIATVLPVPYATPAIAPRSVDPRNWVPYSPDFHSLQGYAGAAPLGLGFSEVARLPGADGAGVTVIDLEGGWILGHEALRAVRFNVWSGSPSTEDGWIEHGTAVSSLLFAPRDGIGISGLVPAARGALASIFSGTPSRQMIAQQIDACRLLLRPGDVLLVEVQRPGPATDFQAASDERGYLPASFWPDVKESIRACVAAGIAVVEVAGNGGVDLSDPKLQGAFDQTGSSLTALGSGDSGGIMVGAGTAPRPNEKARSRLDFSNYGDRVDCQAWGESVVCAGYGDLWGGSGSVSSYTNGFCGTSSAAPLVAAAVASIQGRHKRKFGKPIPPLALRQALAALGAEQAAGDTGRIGPQPSLPAIFSALNLL